MLPAQAVASFGPLRAEIFADSGTSNVSSLLPTDMDFGAVDGITYWSADSMRVLVFPEDTFVLRYADIPVDHAAESGVVAAMLVARAQDYAAFTPNNGMVSVVRGDRIYLVEAPPRALIPPPASCVAIWTDARRKHDSLLVPDRPNSIDTAAHDSSFRMLEGIEERGQADVGQCYAEHVRSDPRFAAIVQQVADIIRRLPSH